MNRRHTDPSEAAEACQHLVVDEAAQSWVGQSLVQQVVDEINTRLHSEDHPFLHQATHPETLQARLVDTLYSLHSSVFVKSNQLSSKNHRQMIC